MGKARDLFLAAYKSNALLVVPGGNEEGWRLLVAAAEEWRREGRHFSAAHAMDEAMQAAWGNGERVNASLRASLEDYARCVASSPLDAHEALVALYRWRLKLRYCEPHPTVQRVAEDLSRELAERLEVIFGDGPGAAGYLVRGVLLSTDLDGIWEAAFPDAATKAGSVWSNASRLTFSLPSAFSLLRGRGDYRGMQKLVARFPTEFATPDLKGWSLAVEGFLAPERAADLFAAAASALGPAPWRRACSAVIPRA